jgi:5-methylcytosine-specific restriction endonuclease McrA
MELRYTFDPERFYLGTLCKHEHRWPGTNLSLRRIYKSPNRITVNHCVACTGRKQSDWLISFIDVQAMGLPDGFKFGKPCKVGHLWNGHQTTLRDSRGKCPKCEKIRQSSLENRARSKAWRNKQSEDYQEKCKQREKDRFYGDPEYAEQKRTYRRERKRKIAAALREQGFTTKGTLPIRADGAAPKGHATQLGEYFKAINDAGRCPSVARLVMDEQRRYWQENPEAKIEHDRWRENYRYSWRYKCDPLFRLHECQRNSEKKARNRGNHTVRITKKEMQARYVEFDNRCAFCGSADRLTIEHVVPRSKGGPHALGNILPACDRCNKNKTNHEVESWYRRQPFFSEARWRKICRVLGWQRASVGQLALL